MRGKGNMGKTYTFSNVNFAYFTTILYASKKEMKSPPFQFNFVNLKMFAARKMTTVIGRRMKYSSAGIFTKLFYGIFFKSKSDLVFVNRLQKNFIIFGWIQYFLAKIFSN